MRTPQVVVEECKFAGPSSQEENVGGDADDNSFTPFIFFLLRPTREPKKKSVPSAKETRRRKMKEKSGQQPIAAQGRRRKKKKKERKRHTTEAAGSGGLPAPVLFVPSVFRFGTRASLGERRKSGSRALGLFWVSKTEFFHQFVKIVGLGHHL